MNNITLAKPWGQGEMIIFRFFFIYFILYTFPLGIGTLPFTWDWAFLNELWTPLIQWTGKHILHLDYEITVLPNGSGDTTWNYVQVFLFTILAFVGMLIWSVLDTKSLGYPKLIFWLTVLIRYYLAITLLGYGIVKIFKTQFPFPFLARLNQPYGESSPMGLLWTFMGYSTAFNFFTGMCEALGGFLLFFRRTKMLGAFIIVAVMSNIVLLNFTYDVPVKLFSLHLLLMTLFVLAPDSSRIIQFFVLNQPTPPARVESVFKEKNWMRGHAVMKVVFILSIIALQVLNAHHTQRTWGDLAPKPVMYGIYDVETQMIRGDTIPPLVGDTKRWKRLTVGWKDWVSLQYMDNVTMSWRFSADTINQKLQLITQDSTTAYQFQYKKEGNLYTLKGELSGDSIHVTMRKKGPSDFLLVNRGFHWINEYPFNR